MALTSEDLNQISVIVKQAVKGEIVGLKSDLDRMEGRLNTAVGLLQRDTYSRLDEHEARIRRLEQAAPH